MKTSDQFIVPIALKFIKFLQRFTIYYWIVRCTGPSWRVVDIWVLSNLLVVVVCYAFAFMNVLPHFVLLFLIVLLGVIRVLDITTYHMEILLEVPQIIRSYSRSFLLAAINYLEIILWFATFYVLLHHNNWFIIKDPILVSAIEESIALMVANSHNIFEFKGNYLLPRIIVTVNSVLGLFMTIAVAARVIGSFPRPEAADRSKS